jgi:hypothetical protein
MCLYPRLIRNKKYIPNKKNGGKIPPLPLNKEGNPDKRVLVVPIKCGNCIECRKRKSNDWLVRLSQEIKDNKNGVMVTLTFSNESILNLTNDIQKKTNKKGYDLDNEIATLAVRRFTERWRKKYKKTVRHWLVTELGHNGTENIHLHGIIFTDKPHQEIRNIWQYGYVYLASEHKGYVNQKTVNYCVKYVHKLDMKHKAYKPKIFASKGIGKGYVKTKNFSLNKFKGKDTRETYINEQGYKFALPIYLRNKAYNENEREKLWQLKLDEMIRYVNGIKIDISKGLKEYKEAVKHARKLSQRYGYTGIISYQDKIYENQLRDIMIKKRVQKAHAIQQQKIPQIKPSDAF